MSDTQRDLHFARSAASVLTNVCHTASADAGWWTDLKTGETLRRQYAQILDGRIEPARNLAEMLCLIHSEISEAMEGVRKGLMDDKLKHRPMLEVELADAAIRIFDMAGGLGLDLAGAIAEKLEFNAKRADHKIENRLADGGKKF